MFIPNGSLLYNTEDKKLYPVLNLTYTDDNDNIITRPTNEWRAGPYSLGNYTFNLIPKEYMFGFRPDQEPTPFENVVNFATSDTVTKVLKKLHGYFPAVTFSFTGNSKDPKFAKDRVYLNALTDDKPLETGEPLGYYAVLEAQHGTQVMLNYVRAWLMSVGMV